MTEEQLAYEGQRKTEIKNYWIPRGDTREIVFEHDLGAEAAVKAARLMVKNSSGAAVVALTLADHVAQWDFSTDYEGVVILAADNTATLDTATYAYGVELIDQNDLVYTPIKGSLVLADDVVDNSGTSPYPSWTTLDDLELQIEQIATCANVSWLTVVATGGAQATLDVQNGAIFTAADDIRLVLDDGTFEDDEIDSISGNELTLVGTIAGEAAVGNVVRIL